MVRRRGDKASEPPGGRAAERLRQFEEARGIAPKQKIKKTKAPAAPTGQKHETERDDEKQVGRKD